VNFSDWIRKMAPHIDTSLGAPIEDYLRCDSVCECPKVPDANGVMRNGEADYDAGMSAGRWIREQQIVRAMRVRATALSGDARIQMLSFADEIEGGR
jgi:hypothetical protein